MASASVHSREKASRALNLQDDDKKMVPQIVVL